MAARWSRSWTPTSSSSRAREDATLLIVSRAYRPSIARLGAELDPATMRRLAEATIQTFTTHIATAITDPGAWTDARQSPTPPEPAPAAETSRPYALFMGKRERSVSHAGRHPPTRI
jgi:hypothetical protein